MPIAHLVQDKDQRTDDIFTESNVEFESFFLSPDVLKGLKNAGFLHPSPIQEKAIPLAKLGVDLICQAKSGTGKTCVFAVSALEAVNTKSNALQVLVLAPTREIAYQIHDVITSIGGAVNRLKCHLFIGGIAEETDIRNLKLCHIAVGTPGRIKSLIEKKAMLTNSVRLFVLDEADKLVEEGSFQKQINWIYSTLPKCKQTMALSATYPSSLANFLENYMNEPAHVRINTTEVALLGIHQYYCVVPARSLPNKTFEEKVKLLFELIKNIPFHQCMVFSNYQTRAEHLSHLLTRKGWPSTFIAGYQAQTTRLQAMDKLKKYNCRIFITTDLTSRGVDCDKVNLIINMDIPWDTETYLHRIGRAGRFGSYGTAITIISSGKEYSELKKISKSMMKDINHINDHEISHTSKLKPELHLKGYSTIRCAHSDSSIQSAHIDLRLNPTSVKVSNGNPDNMTYSLKINDENLSNSFLHYEPKTVENIENQNSLGIETKENEKALNIEYKEIRSSVITENVENGNSVITETMDSQNSVSTNNSSKQHHLDVVNESNGVHSKNHDGVQTSSESKQEGDAAISNEDRCQKSLQCTIVKTNLNVNDSEAVEYGNGDIETNKICKITSNDKKIESSNKNESKKEQENFETNPNDEKETVKQEVLTNKENGEINNENDFKRVENVNDNGMFCKYKSTLISDLLLQWDSISISREEVMNQIYRENKNKEPVCLAVESTNKHCYYGNLEKIANETPLNLVPISKLFNGSTNEQLSTNSESFSEETSSEEKMENSSESCFRNTNLTIKSIESGDNTISSEVKNNARFVSKKKFNLMSVNLNLLNLNANQLPNKIVESSQKETTKRTIIFQRGVNEIQNEDNEIDFHVAHRQKSIEDSSRASFSNTNSISSENETSENEETSGNETDSENESKTDSDTESESILFRSKFSDINESGNETDSETETENSIGLERNIYACNKNKQKNNKAKRYKEVNKRTKTFNYEKFYQFWNIAYENHINNLNRYRNLTFGWNKK